MREASARTQAVNNLKQIALALHNYDDRHQHLPPAAMLDSEGKALLSWRVAILPFVEEEALYRQFKLDEAWDSAHNIPLLNRMPFVFQTPHRADIPIEPHTTYFQVFVGPGTAFDLKERLRIPTSFEDGTANTLLVAEGGRAVPWTKPEDLVYDPDGPLPPLGGVFRGDAPFRIFGSNRWKGMHAALGDASVRSINTESITDQTLRNAIVRNDGRPLGPDWW
jgi:hypothetical protein